MSSKSATVQTPKPSSSKQAVPVVCSKFDKTKFGFSEITADGEYNKVQMTAYTRYEYPNADNKMLVFQTNWMNMSQYGIPPIGEYYKDDKSRAFIKVPLDPNQPSCVSLEQMLSQIDEYCNENAATIFKAFLKKNTVESLFTYIPLVRSPADKEVDSEDDDDDEENAAPKKGKTSKKPVKEPVEKFKYCKVKFDTDFNSGDVKSSVVVHSDAADPNPTPVRASTITEVEDAGLKWGCRYRMIVSVNKLWAQKTKNKDTGKRQWGVGMKLLRVDFQPREGGTPLRDQFASYAFDDEDNSTVSAPVSKKSVKEAHANDDDDEAADVPAADDDEDDDEVAEAAPATTPAPVVAAPVKGSKSTKTTPVVAAVTPAPVVAAAKPVKGKGKAAVIEAEPEDDDEDGGDAEEDADEDGEDEAEEEEEPVVVKPVKKAAAKPAAKAKAAK